MTKTQAISVCQLSHCYDKTLVLQKVDFEINQGEFVGIFGPNGGGKTTLLKLLMGFEKPSFGKIHLFGKEPSCHRKKIGYVPQINRLDKQFPITVLEVVLMGCLSEASFFGKLSNACKEKALSALNKVGLLEKKNERFGSLSGGQAQRVLIARAIVNDPDILFLDEPTASVDPSAEESILALLQELKGKMTILMVTHDLQTIINKVEKLVCVHKNVHILKPDHVCEHYGLGLYHSPIISFGKGLNHNA